MNRNAERRTVRYTFLMTRDEYELAQKVAARDFRTLPEYLRSHIYKGAASLINIGPSAITLNENTRTPGAQNIFDTREVQHGSI